MCQIRRYALTLPNPKSASRPAVLPIGRRMALLRQLDRRMFELFGHTPGSMLERR
jgi:hypothetical protein